MRHPFGSKAWEECDEKIMSSFKTFILSFVSLVALCVLYHFLKLAIFYDLTFITALIAIISAYNCASAYDELYHTDKSSHAKNQEKHKI